jgi:tripartite-type tricarboxylate transporter receptor subunit TctC
MFLRLAALALAFPGFNPAASAQEFPNKPITMLVGFAAGGATDTAARIVAKKLGENLGLSVILLGSVGPLCIAPHLVANLPYDPQKDLAPLTMEVSFPNVLVVHAGVPAKTLAEFVALAKAKPGTLDYASTGIGSASHLAGEMFKQRAGVDIVLRPAADADLGPNFRFSIHLIV